MPKYLSKAEEATWSRAKKKVMKQKGKKRLTGKDWPLVMHVFQNMKKSAASVQYRPYDPLIEKAVRLLEREAVTDLSQVRIVIVDTGSPDYYGKVTESEPNTVHVSLDKIRQSMIGRKEADIVISVAEVIAHEAGHIAANYKGGEAPAEQKEHQFLDKIRNDKDLASKLSHIADELDRAKLYKSATAVDSIVKTSAYIASPKDVSQAILGILKYLTMKVKPESHAKFLNSIRNKLIELSASEISVKNKNPTAGIGATLALIQNLLAGIDAATINVIIRFVIAGLGRL